MKENKSNKLRKQLSFKQNERDRAMFYFLEEEIEGTLGISTYLKMLIGKDEQFLKYLENRKH